MAIDNKYKTQFYIDDTNEVTGPVVRWNSNNQVPFDDMLTEFFVAGWIERQTMLNSTATRKEEASIAIQQYIDNRKKFGYSDEEKAEMDAAFAGETVIDVFTGEVVDY